MSATPAAPLTEDSWIDRRQAAALAECSFDTIRRAEHRHKLPTRTGLGGAVLLNVGGLVAAGVLPATVLGPTVDPAHVAEVGELRRKLAKACSELDAARLAHAELAGRYAQMRETADAHRARAESESAWVWFRPYSEDGIDDQVHTRVA